MKSILGFGLGRSGSVLEAPRPAGGLLPHHDEEALTNLWLELTKAEAGCCKVMGEVCSYREAVRRTQEAEEKLLKDLGASGLTAVSTELRKATDEYLSVVVEMKAKSEEVSGGLQETLGEPVKHYHALYEHLNTLRRQRDDQVAVVTKTQDKLDRLKLKGKRTTDVLVDRDGALRKLRDLNGQLLSEACKFHQLRHSYLQPCIQAYVQTQVDYYGTANSHFSSQIQASRGAHQIPDSQYEATMDNYLSKIKALKIVAT
ncbi:Bridging integrator 3 [Chionoecetes opilio]|uniref:Bridging integrator 3 n=1 Tax=Chionoecetes opilio TaxID=41210 RepID=A0A8J8WAM0_CHIOP|nr:Bridging integrator 3 [Chionoecetes opilio]